jgi:cell division initiation protein
MNLIPKDIKKRDFKKSLRGYDVDEVDAFLETISSHYEKLLVDNKNLTEKVKSLLADIEIYKENESNLQKAIIKTQDIAEEVIQNAKKRSEIIIKEAELDARKVRQDIEDEILNKKQELEEIKLRNDKIIEDLRVYLNDKTNELDEFVKSKKIFRMELSKMEHHESEHEHESKSEEKEETRNIKKVYINNNDSYENQKKSFDDSFEVK